LFKKSLKHAESHFFVLKKDYVSKSLKSIRLIFPFMVFTVQVAKKGTTPRQLNEIHDSKTHNICKIFIFRKVIT